MAPLIPIPMSSTENAPAFVLETKDGGSMRVRSAHVTSLQTGAHLAAWTVARQHGVTVETCDKIADAVLSLVIQRLGEWSGEDV